MSLVTPNTQTRDTNYFPNPLLPCSKLPSPPTKVSALPANVGAVNTVQLSLLFAYSQMVGEATTCGKELGISVERDEVAAK